MTPDDNNQIIKIDDHQNQLSNNIAGAYKAIEELVAEFLAQHPVRKSSRDRYEKSLRQFLNWAQGKDIATITKANLLDYKESLHQAGKSTKTIGAYLVAIRLFYEYLADEYDIKNIARNVASPKQTNKFEHKALTEPECTQLLDHFVKAENLRNLAMVNLMLRTGMRTIEVSRALVEDVDKINGKPCLYLHGKGRDDKKEYVLLTPKALDLLKQYMATRPDHSPREPLFVCESNNGTGTAITTKTVSRICREGLDAIGLTGKMGYTAHSLRHTAGSIMLANGTSLNRVQQVLRHHNASTTLGYVQMADEKLRVQESPESKLDEAF